MVGPVGTPNTGANPAGGTAGGTAGGATGGTASGTAGGTGGTAGGTPGGTAGGTAGGGSGMSPRKRKLWNSIPPPWTTSPPNTPFPFSTPPLKVASARGARTLLVMSDRV